MMLKFLEVDMIRNFLLVIISLALFLSGCATANKNAATDKVSEEAAVVSQAPKPSEDEITAKVAEELKDLGEAGIVKEEPEKTAEAKVTYDIPITINRQVEYFINYFQKKIPKHFKRWLARSSKYAPIMQPILKEHGLPKDLLYLSMIESGFNCNAYSHAHAVGPWQFIRGTGKRYGLKINYWVDERRDPVKATHAAANYLKDLYEEFGSWYLAAAAYNAGEGKIRKALKRYGGTDFWSISKNRQRYLKRETKQYVPKMIAAALMAKEPEKYGFTDIKYQEPLRFDTVKVHPGTSLGVAAKLAGIKSKELGRLNPELRRWCTPPSGGYYSLKIPAGRKASFQAAYAKLSPKDRQARIGSIVVRIQKGETLGKLARVHGVRLADLMAMNPKLNPRRLRIGQKVFIPPSRTFASKSAKKSSSKARTSIATRPGSSRKIVHVVKKGDNLWTIGRTYNLSHRKIMRWNGKRTSSLSVGQKLVLYVPISKAEAKVKTGYTKPKAANKVVQTTAKASKTRKIYKVRKGDNLWTIGRKFGVSTRQLKRWNGKKSSKLSIGQKLVVYVDAPKQVAASSGQKVYKVRKGDNLWLIGRRHGVSPAQIKRWNGLRSNAINPGDTLLLNLQ